MVVSLELWHGRLQAHFYQSKVFVFEKYIQTKVEFHGDLEISFQGYFKDNFFDIGNQKNVKLYMMYIEYISCMTLRKCSISQMDTFQKFLSQMFAKLYKLLNFSTFSQLIQFSRALSTWSLVFEIKMNPHPIIWPDLLKILNTRNFFHSLNQRNQKYGLRIN